MKAAITGVTLIFAAVTMFAGEMDPATCPMHEQHMKAAKASADPKHGAEVDARHDTLVASHTSTTHNFRLFEDGGAVELRANDAGDKATIDAVRVHLHDVAGQFAKNDFTTPMFVHAKTPSGTEDMERLHDAITFRYETLDRGGRIRFSTKNPEALAAIHEFMRFQVVEHRTGDSAKVEADR